MEDCPSQLTCMTLSSDFLQGTETCGFGSLGSRDWEQALPLSAETGTKEPTIRKCHGTQNWAAWLTSSANFRTEERWYEARTTLRNASECGWTESCAALKLWLKPLLHLLVSHHSRVSCAKQISSIQRGYPGVWDPMGSGSGGPTWRLRGPMALTLRAARLRPIRAAVSEIRSKVFFLWRCV